MSEMYREADNVDTLRQAGRILLATWAGIFLGAEVLLSGPSALIQPGLISLYLLMFLVTDELLVRRRLSQRHIFVLGMLFEIWLGALVGQELYQPGLAFPFVIAGINIISLLLLTCAWGMFLVTWMHLVEWLCRRPEKLGFPWLRRILIAGALVFLGLFYFSNQLKPAHYTGDILLLTFGVVGTIGWLAWTRHAQKPAKEPQFSRGIIVLGALFILFSLLSIFVPLLPQFHIYWTYLVWMPLFFFFASRRTLRL